MNIDYQGQGPLVEGDFAFINLDNSSAEVTRE